MIPLIDFVLNVDKYIDLIISNYGLLVYAFMFLIIFIETGVVIMPFLPGDSLLFVLGAFAARGQLSLLTLIILLVIAAFVGNITNYLIGRYLGEKVFSKFINPNHLVKTKSFYSKYGDKTLILARFVPIVRTIAPFLAGVGKMPYSKLITFSLLGSILWVVLFVLAGFFFGNIPLIENNLSIVIISIIIVSLIPAVIGYFKNK